MAHIERITSVRHTLNGKRVPSTTPGAIATRTRSRFYYGVGVPGHPPGKRVKLSPDKATAQRLLDDLVRAAERGRAGLPDQAAARKPLAEHLPSTLRQQSSGCSASRPGHAGRGPRRSHRQLPAGRAARRPRLHDRADLTAATAKAVAAFLAAKMATPKADGGWSAQTARHHLAGCRRFARWLAGKRLPVDPACLDAVPTPDAANRRTFRRRECSPAELAAVLDAAAAGPPRFGLTGPQRQHLYLAAYYTGFRVEELAALTVANFEFGARPA